VDILRSRSLSTPDSRLPGAKEVPPSWSRGIAASRELAWWDGSVYQGAATFVWWRYHEFLSRCIRLGLEPWLPRRFGGLEFPHYKKKLEIISPKTRRMVSILLRADLNLENLLDLESVGSIWNPTFSGLMGQVSQEILRRIVTVLEVSNLDVLADDLGMSVTWEYPKWWTLKEPTDVLRKEGWIPLKTFLKELNGAILERMAYLYESPRIDKVPSLQRISRSFKSLRDKIISRDPYRYRELRSASFQELQKRLDWKLLVVFVKGKPEEIAKSLILRELPGDPVAKTRRRFLVRLGPEYSMNPFFVKA
jgi:hypothetical protein